MKSPADTLSPAEQAAFFRSVENVKQATSAQLRAHPGDTHPINFVGNLHRGIDQVIEEAAGQGAALACKAGCSHCCSARVEVSALEAFRIAEAILCCPEPEIERIVAQLRAHVAANSGKTAWKQRTPCPFLNNDLCTIYALRPAGCRKAHSLDREACSAGAETLPQRLDIALAAEALIQGTVAGYQKAGLDASRHEFVQALLLAMTDPQARDRWLSFKALFAASDS